MKRVNNVISTVQLKLTVLLILCISICFSGLNAQDSTGAPVAKKKLYTKNTFEGNLLIDNQSVMVPIKGTFEFYIQHRFGTISNGFTDLYGIYSGANMRLSASYVPIKNVQIGFGSTNDRMQVDGNLKIALLKQTRDWAMPVSVTYYGNVAMDTRAKNSSLPIVTTSDRFTYFNQLIIASKVCERFSIQVAPSISYYNNVAAYTDAAGKLQPAMKNEHLAISYGGKIKLSEGMSLLLNFDQPLTQHAMNNPRPNVSAALDMSTSGHDFQITFGNYGYLLQQDNNFGNQNDFKRGQYSIGFNISRLWNF
jgi:Membrane bound beta barrel domain (DUF5777)